jgi:signal transduction histidine kinase/ActR/RegA family two-component response regulator
MSLLLFTLQHRLDLLFFAASACFALLLCSSMVHHRRPGARIAMNVWWLVGSMIAVVALAAEWAGRSRQEALRQTISGLGTTYALELQKLGHAQVTDSTPSNDPTYLALIEAQKNWLRVNPFIADLYTFRKHDDSRVAFVVDSETDYNRDGLFDGAREERTEIGEIYEETNEHFFAALQGQPSLDLTFEADRWGVWVASLTPIYDKDGNVEAGLGIDFPASSWVTSIITSRALVFTAGLVLIAIFLSRETLVTLIRAEIKQREAAEQELHRAVAAAQSANNAKGEFLAVMSHEIRTPLTAVLGFASVLSETKLDPTQHRYVDTIISAGDRLVGMVNDVLDLSKIEEGKLTLDSIAWSPALVINEVIDLLTPSAVEKDLLLRCDQRFGDALALEGDPARVRQILVNLVSNAIKFTDHGEVTLRASWTSSETPLKGNLVFEIHDTGIGISSEKLPGLFKQFTQIHGESRRYSGAGLGLAICKRLIDLMHGTLTVESLLGEGSHFTVTLPCLAIRSAPGSTPPNPGSSSSGGSAPAVRGRALIVDDQAVNRELLKIMLRRQGYFTDLASSGEEAVALSASTQYSIIFMDLEMPGMDGFQTTRKIRERPTAGGRVPIIAITATTARGTREKCLEAGMDEYLTKPVYLPALKSTLTAMTSATPAARNSQ